MSIVAYPGHSPLSALGCCRCEKRPEDVYATRTLCGYHGNSPWWVDCGGLSKSLAIKSPGTARHICRSHSFIHALNTSLCAGPKDSVWAIVSRVTEIYTQCLVHSPRDQFKVKIETTVNRDKSYPLRLSRSPTLGPVHPQAQSWRVLNLDCCFIHFYHLGSPIKWQSSHQMQMHHLLQIHLWNCLLFSHCSSLLSLHASLPQPRCNGLNGALGNNYHLKAAFILEILFYLQRNREF